jgi:hypothetical protein
MELVNVLNGYRPSPSQWRFATWGRWPSPEPAAPDTTKLVIETITPQIPNFFDAMARLLGSLEDPCTIDDAAAASWHTQQRYKPRPDSSPTNLGWIDIANSGKFSQPPGGLAGYL